MTITATQLRRVDWTDEAAEQWLYELSEDVEQIGIGEAYGFAMPGKARTRHVVVSALPSSDELEAFTAVLFVRDADHAAELESEEGFDPLDGPLMVFDTDGADIEGTLKLWLEDYENGGELNQTWLETQLGENPDVYEWPDNVRLEVGAKRSAVAFDNGSVAITGKADELLEWGEPETEPEEDPITFLPGDEEGVA